MNTYHFDDGIPERLPDLRDAKNRKAHHRGKVGGRDYAGQHGNMHGQSCLNLGAGASLRDVPRRIYEAIVRGSRYHAEA